MPNGRGTYRTPEQNIESAQRLLTYADTIFSVDAVAVTEPELVRRRQRAEQAATIAAGFAQLAAAQYAAVHAEAAQVRDGQRPPFPGGWTPAAS
jgi:hypothetical protein